MAADSQRLPVIGWREWLALPELGVTNVKAKVDTGARSSALHAFDLETVRHGRKEWARFKIHPLQRDSATVVAAEAEVVEWRRVRSSTGHQTLRPVILTTAHLMGRDWPIELTLATRDSMGFRMLLGREAVRGRFLVDPGRSFVGGKPRRKSLRKRKSKRR